MSTTLIVVLAVSFVGWPLAVWFRNWRIERQRAWDIENARYTDDLTRPDGIIEIPPGAVSMTFNYQPVWNARPTPDDLREGM